MHSTKGKHDTKEEQRLKEHIMKHKLFGPIIRLLTNVINNNLIILAQKQVVIECSSGTMAVFFDMVFANLCMQD